jgi:WhiB family redox-sensing transcriptional regulator
MAGVPGRLEGNVKETVTAIETMRAEGRDWAFIAKALGVKQNSLAKKFKKWRDRDLTDIVVPGIDGVKAAVSTSGVLELLKAIGPRRAWQAQALCAKMADSDQAFFPIPGGTARPAKSVCRECPVRAQCLEFALDTNEKYGVWGGLSERERKALRSTTEWRQRDVAA